MLVDGAVLGGYGGAAFFKIIETTHAETNKKTISVGELEHFTGEFGTNQSYHIASDLPVATEGTFSASLETTQVGAGTSAFMRKHLMMYRHPQLLRAGSNAEEIVDEKGRGRGTSGVPIPNDMKLFAVFFGGDFVGSANITNDTVNKYIKFALVSVGNETAGGSFSADTYMRRTYTLTGHYPDNRLELTLNDAALAPANVDFKIKTPLTLVLEKDVQVDEAQLIISYEEVA